MADSKAVQELRDTCHDWTGIDLTPEQAESLLQDPKVASNYASGGMDTCTREAAMEALGVRIVGRPWPIYGDGKDAGEKFFAELRERAPGLGYRLVGGA